MTTRSGEFLWNGKKSKIAYGILQNPKDQGGLNLVNLKKKDTSLKATWPLILKDEYEYARLVYSILRCNDLGEDIWRCSIEPTEVSKLKCKSDFWRDVLSSWNEYNFFHQKRIENQMIWYNSYIKIEDKLVFWADSYRKGLKYVHQLFDNNMEFISYETAKLLYGLSKLRFNSLKVSIPVEWKTFFMTVPKISYFPLPPSNYDIEIESRRGLSRRVYKYISEDATILNNKFVKWSQELGEDICEGGVYGFAKIHSKMYKVTNVIKFRSFQYRLLQRGLVTNVQLYKWGIVSSPLCFFCLETTETVVHIMTSCSVIKGIWQNFEEFVVENYMVDRTKLSITPRNIITNTIYPIVGHVVNFLCLITKQYIYRCKCLKNRLNFEDIIRMFRHYQCIEKYIAKKNGNEAFHKMKWASQESGLN